MTRSPLRQYGRERGAWDSQRTLVEGCDLLERDGLPVLLEQEREPLSLGLAQRERDQVLQPRVLVLA
jgi:hypothetical protein